MLGDAAYNVVSRPRRAIIRIRSAGGSTSFRASTITAGFELGTGLSVNIVAPADAAAALTAD